VRGVAGDRRARARARCAARSSARQADELGRAAHKGTRTRLGRVTEELWGGETRKAIDNFPVSGEPIPLHVARWLGRIKAAAARVIAALDRIVNDLIPALDRLAGSLAAKAAEFDDVVKSGRTHWMDAVPVTLGQEFGGYASQVREGKARVESSLERLGKIPLGGTAV